MTPVLVLACGCLLLRWLERSRAIDAALLGVAVYALVLFEPTALIVGVLFAALLVRALVRGDIAFRTAVRQAAVASSRLRPLTSRWFCGSVSILISAFRHVAADATRFNVIARRPYDIWVRQNLVDFLFGIGMCQLVLFWAALGDGLAGLQSRRRVSGAMVLLGLATVAMVGLADGIGVNRGEVIRLWIFLACFCQIPAAYVCARLDSRAAFTLVLITTLLQDALGSSMMGFIIPG